MKQMTVRSVEYHDPQNRPHWRVYYDAVEGSRLDLRCHSFPSDALSQQAAKRGIDPTDVDTLLDVVLHELHLPESSQTTRHQLLSDRMAAARSQVVIQDPEGHLDRIREHHLAQEMSETVDG